MKEKCVICGLVDNENNFAIVDCDSMCQECFSEYELLFEGSHFKKEFLRLKKEIEKIVYKIENPMLQE